MRPARAAVVGSGPNGLAAAIALAQAGCHVTLIEAADEVGGGTRSAERAEPGVVHDVCSASHPFAAASPYLATLPLADHGLTWAFPEVDLAHPLDDEPAALLHSSLDRTAEELGADGARWRRVFAPVVDDFDAVVGDVLGPLLRVPRHPLAMTRFGLRAGLPATTLLRAFSTERARSLFAGCAAHVVRPLDRPATAGVGVMLVAASHRHGWPVAVGGTAALSRAMTGLLQSLDGEVVLGRRITSLAELDEFDSVLLDVSPRAFAEIAGDRLPARSAGGYRRFRHGPAAFKVDFTIRGDVPWRDAGSRAAGTLHLGGSAREVVAAEAMVAAGRLPDRPFVLVGQQYVADPSRSRDGLNPLWTYAHVPGGWSGDVTGAIVDQIERFAPGFTGRVVSHHATGPQDWPAYNANYVDGDIFGGSNTVRQLAFRPVLRLDPYRTPIPRVYLCSASTPPGAGTHGMCGWQASRRALADLARD